MTTHVFIVSEQSFKVHIEYMFVGTGCDNDVDFNGLSTTTLKYQAENGLVSMMSDFSRVREDDFVIFYVQASNKKEGKFYGVYQINSKPFIEHRGDKQYLFDKIGKNLTFRALIKPYKVYAEGITEWEALDDIRGINSPNQMLWSLIYRKLKGNRGNTMITLYEAERLISLIKTKNGNKEINANSYSYKKDKIRGYKSAQKKYYLAKPELFDIVPRLIMKKQNKRAYESHLQMFITQNLGRHRSLDNALGIQRQSLEWIGNEVACGVGMQRIDIMFSQKLNNIEREVVPIELKAVPASMDNIRQLSRYIDWIEQYYVSNRPSTIRPVLLCPASKLSSETQKAFKSFNAKSKGRYLPLEYIEFTINGNELIFTNTPY